MSVIVTVSTGPRAFRTKQDVRDHIAELMRFIPALPDEEPVEDNFEEVRELDAATRDDYPERAEAAAVLAASIDAGTPVTVADDSPFADRHHDPDAAWAAGDDNPLRIAGGVQ